MSKLVEWLREIYNEQELSPSDNRVVNEAADRIEALESVVRELIREYDEMANRNGPKGFIAVLDKARAILGDVK